MSTDARSKDSVVMAAYQPRLSSPTRFLRRDADILQEPLRPASAAKHVIQRPQRDALAFHVDEEIGDAAMLGGVRVRPHQDVPPLGARMVGG